MNIVREKEVDEDIELLFKYQAILLQNNPHDLLPYTIKDVQDTHFYLSALTKLDYCKKQNIVTLARPLIQAFLYNHYSWDAPLISNYDKYTVKEISSKNIFKISNLKFLKSLDRGTPSKSVRDHINIFFESYKSFDKNNLLFSNANFEDIKSRYSICISQIPAFLLLFSYYDNRDFSAKNMTNLDSHKLPRFRGSASNLPAYKNLTSRLYALLNSNRTLFSKESVLYHADKCFSCCKLNLLISYYKIYTQESFLNSIIQTYSLTFSEIMSLKEQIIKNIFEDAEFIKEGLESEFLDFMLPFHIFLLILVSFRTPSASTYETLREDLGKAKQRAKSFITSYCLQSSLQDFCMYNQNGNIDILNTENKIKALLTQNKFFLKYASQIPDSLFQNNHFILSEYYPSWDDIKQRFSSTKKQ